MDTPPSAYMADAGYLSKQLDAMLYVVRHDYTDKHLVEEGLHSLNQDCADGVGYVLNAVDNKMKTNDKYSYRKYGYKSYSLKENKSLDVMNTKSDLKKQESIMTPSELQTDALKNE